MALEWGERRLSAADDDGDAKEDQVSKRLTITEKKAKIHPLSQSSSSKPHLLASARRLQNT